MSSTIVGIGVDAVSVPRWARVLKRTPSIETHVFTDSERSRASADRSREIVLAGYFAVKEACRKALRTAEPWKGMEIHERSKGPPALTVRDRPRIRTHVTITRRSQLAVAIVIIEDLGSLT